MNTPKELKREIIARLSKVQDPGTSIDVVSMRIIRNIDVKEGGQITIILKPGSTFCPLAAKLASDVKTAVESIKGVMSVDVSIIDHVNAEMLNQLLRE